ALDFRDDDSRLLSTRYGGRFSGSMNLRGGRLERGMLYFGPLNQEFSVRQSDSQEPGLLVAGELEKFDLAAWRAVAEAFAMDEGAQGAAVLRLVDVNVGQLDLFGRSLRQANAQLRPDPEGWRLSLRSDVLAGDFLLPEDEGRPYAVTLDYLRLPPGEKEADGNAVAATDALAQVDPAQLPPIDFTTAELTVGERNLGAWSFELRPRAGGATIADLRADMTHARISDA